MKVSVMKYLKQFSIIIMISFIGEFIKYLLPFKIPASIYGLLLLFAALQFEIIKLDSVKDASKFLIEIMPVMFIPAGVGLLESWGVVHPMLYPIAATVVISTIIVMAVSGRVTQFVIKIEEKRQNKHEGNVE